MSIDNAPIHTSGEFVAAICRWVQRGLIVKYLPPYCPHLNKIEILWRRIKYQWLPFAAYTDFKALLDSIQHILRHYGQQYRIDFQIS